MDKIDLHIHSTHSDGILSPYRIVTTAVARRLSAISITDHDCITAIAEAKQAGREYGIEVVSGIELSTLEHNIDVHLLGYFFNEKSPRLIEYLDFLKDERRKRAKRILRKLDELGVHLQWKNVLARAQNGLLGRPHIAAELIEQGFARDKWDSFDRYLGEKGSAFVQRFKLPTAEGIQLIAQAGGVSLIAHPTISVLNRFLNSWIKSGLNGIEVIHPRFSQEQSNTLKRMVNEKNLLMSGGSDCHGNRNGEIIIGQYPAPYSFYETLKAAQKKLYSSV